MLSNNVSPKQHRPSQLIIIWFGNRVEGTVLRSMRSWPAFRERPIAGRWCRWCCLGCSGAESVQLRSEDTGPTAPRSLHLLLWRRTSRRSQTPRMLLECLFHPFVSPSQSGCCWSPVAEMNEWTAGNASVRIFTKSSLLISEFPFGQWITNFIYYYWTTR